MKDRFLWLDIILRVLSYLLVALLASVLTLRIFTKSQEASKLVQLESLIEECFIGEADTTAMEDAAADAMVQSLGDRWSYYIPASQYASHMEQMNNAYVGVGITITQEEEKGFRIEKVEQGGPADTAGVLPGDLITAIDEKSTVDMTMEEARELVRGEEGTQVVFTLLREEKSLTVTITRAEVQTVVATGRMLEGNVGLVTIANFDARCAEETIAQVDSLIEQGATALLFDVRFNPGGYADEMVKVLDYLLPEGDVFRTVDYAGKESVDRSDAACIQLPMAVLVNESSYSAAEFFAATLQEYGVAFVAGEKTVGKGYFQSTFRMGDGSAVGLSIGKFFTSQGRNLEGVGITPDLPVSMDEETRAKLYYGTLEPEEDPQLQAALERLLEEK